MAEVLHDWMAHETSQHLPAWCATAAKTSAADGLPVTLVANNVHLADVPVIRREAAHLRRVVARLIERLTRTELTAKIVAAWARATEDGRQRRREAFFDSMGQQMRAAKKTCVGFQILVSRQEPLRHTIALWRGFTQLACKTRSWISITNWAVGNDAANTSALSLCRALAAWRAYSRSDKDVGRRVSRPPFSGGVCSQQQPLSATSALTSSCFTPRQPSARCVTRCSSTPRGGSSEAFPRGAKTTEVLDHFGDVTGVTGSETLRPQVRRALSARSELGAARQRRCGLERLNSCIGDVFLERRRSESGQLGQDGGVDDGSASGHCQNRDFTPPMPPPRMRPPDMTPRATLVQESEGGVIVVGDTSPRYNGDRGVNGAASLRLLHGTSVEDLPPAKCTPINCVEGSTVARIPPQRHGGTESQMPRGPERFFYDVASYTGCARYGGPAVVDRFAMSPTFGSKRWDGQRKDTRSQTCHQSINRCGTSGNIRCNSAPNNFNKKMSRWSM
eukprot:TRINITY_DN43325_c0_g1_i1.p1 TRINITY_DN43325_c0_g1~~TRINITY_DN43325_c0_g1_i1.p1  ORF type:complete len:543 (+),score=56.80 TRINITY_DN43325_c0_g1_i1:119-1630(+)